MPSFRAGETKLLVGDMESCAGHVGPIIHACKSPCYMAMAGTPREKDDPEYLAIEQSGMGIGGDQLYLNLIDPPLPLFKVQSFITALDWIDAHGVLDITAPDILIHCNQGASRSPTIALLWMAKRARELGSTFAEARTAFSSPLIFNRGMGAMNYMPGAGIVTFLSDPENWNAIR